MHPATHTAMPMEEIINERYACREFDMQRSVPQEDIHFILDAARLAPSSLALEPWQFLVVQKPQQKEEIAQIAYGQSHIKNCNFIVILLSRIDFQDYFVERLKQKNLPQERFEKTLNTYLPFLQAMDDRKKLAYTDAQNHLALMQMTLAASSRKVDSCIIGGFDHDALNQYLKLDTNTHQSCLMVAFGYRKAGETSSPKTRLPFNEVVKFL